MQRNIKISIVIGVLLTSGLLLAGCQKSNPAQPGNPGNPNPQPGGSSNSAPVEYTINPGDKVFFWGEGCPHCTNVEKFLQENPQVKEKTKLKEIEVFNDLNGQKVFMQKTDECGLEKKGIPVLYQDGKCIQGDQPIIEELKKYL